MRKIKNAHKNRLMETQMTDYELCKLPRDYRRFLANSPRCEIILFWSFSEYNWVVLKALCHYAQTNSSSVSLPTMTMSL